MRKLVIGLVILVLLVAGAWLALRELVDAERHEEALRAALESATGWSASFGRVEVSMIRGLRLGMRDVRLVDRRGGSQIEAPRAIFKAEVSALLRGELALREVELLRPEIVIARDPARGWRWPQPGRAAPGAPSLSELTIRGGRLALAGPTGSRTLDVEEISAVLTPATGRVWGTGLLGTGPGRVKWLGRLGEGVELTFEAAEADVLAAWLPPDARPSGTVDLALRVDASGTRCEGRLDAESLRLFPEREALERVGVEFSVAADEGAWRLDAVTIEADGVSARAEGWLAPLDARVLVEDAPLGAALAASLALVRRGPPGIEDEGEGALSATLHVGGPGPRRWWWSALTLRGARLEAARGAPPLHAATLELTREGRGAELVGRVRGTLAGGSLVARLRVPAGERVELQGGVRDARAALLLGAGGTDARVSMQGEATLALGAGAGDGALVSGRLSLEGEGWSEPSWELAPLLVEACPDPPPPEPRAREAGEGTEREPDQSPEPPPPPPPPEPPGGLPLAWTGEFELEPGVLRSLAAAGPAWRLEGEGRYRAGTKALDLRGVAGPLASARDAFRASCGAGLAPGDQDPWPLSVVLRGPLGAPRIQLAASEGERVGEAPLESRP